MNENSDRDGSEEPQRLHEFVSATMGTARCVACGATGRNEALPELPCPGKSGTSRGSVARESGVARSGRWLAYFREVARGDWESDPASAIVDRVMAVADAELTTLRGEVEALTRRAQAAEQDAADWKAEAQRHHDDWHALRVEIGEHRRRTKAAETKVERVRELCAVREASNAAAWGGRPHFTPTVSIEAVRVILDADAPEASDLTEQGRRLASERDDLIAQGVGPAQLAVPLAPEASEAGEPEPWKCPRCLSTRWVRVSFTRGMSFRAQCVPCGKVTPLPEASDGSEADDV